MSNRWLRFGIAVLALGAAGAAGFRLFQQDKRLTASILTARSTDLAAESALTTIPEVKAALHAYVAEGQGQAFWTARAAMLLERLRASLLELDGPAAAAGASLTEVLGLADRLGAAEQKAREHVRADQKLLAGEIIFTDARDLLDAMRVQLVRTRTQLADAAAVTQAEIQREQKLLAVGVFGVLAFATLLLVIPGGVAPTVNLPKGPHADPPDEFESSARIVTRTPIKPEAAPPAGKAAGVRPGGTASAPSTVTAAPAQTVSDRLPVARPAPPVAPATPAATSAAVSKPSAAPAPPASPTPSLREAAAICTELARASQSIEVSNLLARAAKVLDASGAVVWMASPDGRELYPAASAGYDERLLTRIGTIPRTANNVTAGAIRSGTPKASARAGQSAAALAIPLLTPLGAVGVLSAELKNVAEVDETRLAVATIFAAQLASLVGSRAAGAVASTAPAPQDTAHGAR